MDKPMKMAENLHTDWLAIIRTHAKPVFMGSLAREALKDIVPNIEGNILP